MGAVRQRSLQGHLRRSLGTTSRILGSCVSRRALGWVEGQRRGAVVVTLGSGDSALALGGTGPWGGGSRGVRDCRPVVWAREGQGPGEGAAGV